MRPGTLLRWHALNKILKAEIKEGSCILDIGGFDGYVANNIAKQYKRLLPIVIDLDLKGLELAKKSNLNVLCASALKLPLRENCADVILCCDILEHVEADQSLMEEIARVLKPKGKLIITTPFENGVTFPFMSKESILKANKDFGHVRLGYSLRQLEKMCNACHLKVVNNDAFFNALSRFVYWLMPLPGAFLLFKIIIFFEPYIKFHAQEHIIIAEREE